MRCGLDLCEGPVRSKDVRCKGFYPYDMDFSGLLEYLNDRCPLYPDSFGTCPTCIRAASY